VNLRRVALADLGAVGYLPAADAIARSTENSFKIIALKGLQHQIDEVSCKQRPPYPASEGKLKR